MKLLVLLSIALLMLVGLFYLIHSAGWLGLNDWRLEMLMALVLIGIPASMAARAM